MQQGQEYDEVYRGLIDICQRMKKAKSMWERETEKEKQTEDEEKGKADRMRKRPQRGWHRREKGKPKKVKKMMRKQ